MGLRVDVGRTGEIKDASEALQRPAWFAFQRLASTLSVRTGDMLHPAKLASVTDDMVDEPLNALVVLGYRLLGGGYAYLALIDPSAEVTPADAYDLIASTTDTPAFATVRATLPNGTYFPTDAGDAQSLPYASAPFDPDDIVRLPLRRSFSPGDAPLLVLSQVELTWVVRVA